MKIPPPRKSYEIIYCDPPWRYDNRTPGREVENHYCTMSIDEICNLKVPSSRNCILFLWATSPLLEYAFLVLKSWGFSYKSHAVWDKVKIGLGYWFRGQHEILIVAVKGSVSPPTPENRIPSVMRFPRGSHSSKPDQVRDWIQKAYPKKTKLEMFARPFTDMWPKHDGWDTFGNEMKNDVNIK